MLVTWQPSRCADSSPDVRSVAVLVPENLPETISASFLFPSASLSSYELEDLQKKRGHRAAVGLDGKALLTGVPPGRYRLLIVSKNARPQSDWAVQAARKDIEAIATSGDPTALFNRVRLHHVTQRGRNRPRQPTL